jgi:serine phosphatase RsbU (regulator of sigma subunit)
MLASLLPSKSFSSRFRWVWVALILLAPLAYAGAVYLFFKNDPSLHAGLKTDRAQTIKLAAQYAAAKGYDVSGWQQYCVVNTQNNLHFYYRMHPGPERDRAEQLFPAVRNTVLFRQPESMEMVEVYLTPAGQPFWFQYTAKRPDKVVADDAEAARRLAETALRARTEVADLFSNVSPNVAESSQQGAITRQYTWQQKLAALPGLQLKFTAAVRGGKLVSEKLFTEFESGFKLPRLKWERGLSLASFVLYLLSIIILVIFGTYRFVQRARQRELSYHRIGLLGLVFSLALSSYILFTDAVIYDVAKNLNQNFPVFFIRLQMSFFWVFCGLFIGMAYASAEGDVREANPGKLTAIDALITGKLFSHNVARAVVVGSALGGWMFLSMRLFTNLLAGRPNMGDEFRPLVTLMMPYPIFSTLMSWPMDVVLILVLGLLLPLPFLQRRLKNPKLIVALLTLFIWIACQAPFLSFRPWAAVLVTAAIRTIFVLLAFFYFDVLTAAFTLIAPVFLSQVLMLYAQPAPIFKQHGSVAFLATAVFLLIQLFFVFKGHRLEDEEVRPFYARNLAERQSMQAEVSAAREAQQRLLPLSLPMSSHFSVAASCVPAHEVGGDFFDFFELEQGKLGILIAEGNGKGLGAALTIAYAKGFLMPKIKGNTLADDSPTEIVRSLQDRLSSLLGTDGKVGLAYAVLDPTDGVLRYARIGDYPRVFVQQQEHNDKLRVPEESELKFSATRGGDEPIRLIQGRCELEPGDGLVLFTDGIAKSLAQRRKRPEEELSQILVERSDAHLQEALMKVVNESVNRARKEGQEDDLTAVVVQYRER